MAYKICSKVCSRYVPRMLKACSDVPDVLYYLTRYVQKVFRSLPACSSFLGLVLALAPRRAAWGDNEGGAFRRDVHFKIFKTWNFLGQFQKDCLIFSENYTFFLDVYDDLRTSTHELTGRFEMAFMASDATLASLSSPQVLITTSPPAVASWAVFVRFSF